MRKRLDKAHDLMTKAWLRYRQFCAERDKLFSRRTRRDRSSQAEPSPKVSAAIQRCKQAYDHYVRCLRKYEGCRENYTQLTRQLQCDMRPLASKIGIPSQYLDSFHVAVKKDGEVHFYYGGEDKPLGRGHAHVVLNSDRSLKYWRYPKMAAAK